MGRGETAELQTIADNRSRGSLVWKLSNERVAQAILGADWVDHLNIREISVMGDHSYCEEEGICRCQEIEEAWVETPAKSSDQLITASRIYTGYSRLGSTAERSRWNETSTDQAQILREVYAIDRVLSRVPVNMNDFDISTVGGYYGEEIGEVRVLPGGLWEQAIRGIDLDDDSKLVEGMLELEARKIPDDLKGKSWSRELVGLDEIDLTLADRDPLTESTIRSRFSKRSRDSSVRSSRTEDQFTWVEVGPDRLPQGIARRDGDRFQLIDGRCRVSAAIASSSDPNGIEIDSVALWVCD